MKFKGPNLGGSCRTRSSRSSSGIRALATPLCAVAGAVVLLSFVLTGVHAAVHAMPARAHAPAAPKTKASDLLRDMQKGTAFIGKAVKTAGPKTLSPKIKGQRPFFAALKKTNRDISALTKAVAAKKDKALFKAMDRTGRSVYELRNAFELSGSKDANVTAGMKALVTSYEAFRRNFGPQAARVKAGGALTPDEAKRAAALREKYSKAAAQLNGVRGKGGKAAAVVSEVANLISALASLLSSGGDGTFTIVQYTELIYFEEQFTGEWYAISSYVAEVDPASYAAFSTVDASIVEINSYVETVETSFSYESTAYWSSFESTEIEYASSSEVSVSESEISQYESYIEETTVETSVDEFDVTLGDEDVAILDHDDDGTLDGADADDDGDGIDDAKDTDDDGDGVDDFLEVDADHDGTPDAIDEDDDNDGLDDAMDKDDDGDGTPDDKDYDRDNDNDGIADAKDPDDDNDGTPDAKDDDDDGDGVDDIDDLDDDNDGVDDADDADHDDDGDGTPDDEDADDDNDGTPDDADMDDDGDGTPDAADDDYDADDDNDDAGDDADEDPGDDDGSPDDDEEPE